MTTPGIAYTFTAHNIQLQDGSQTLPGRELTAQNGICQAALRDMELAFPDRRLYGRPATVADLGCLEGGYAVALARAGYDVTGIEARAENVACCQYAASRLEPGLDLRFTKGDVRDVVAAAEPGQWDAVLCCGLLYHLDNPVAFLHELGRVTRRLLIVNSHYSTRPDDVHEGHPGHWHDEGQGRWASWKNGRSFWLARTALLSAMRDAGFDLVLEQHDYLADITAGDVTEPDARGMFTGVKL